MAEDDVDELGARARWARSWTKWATWVRVRWPEVLLAGVAAGIAIGLAALAYTKAPLLYAAPNPPAPDPNPVLSAARESAYAARDSSRQAAIATTRASVLALLAGLGALVTIAINFRNSRTQLRNTAIASQTLATTQETFRVTERGQVVSSRVVDDRAARRGDGVVGRPPRRASEVSIYRPDSLGDDGR